MRMRTNRNDGTMPAQWIPSGRDQLRRRSVMFVAVFIVSLATSGASAEGLSPESALALLRLDRSAKVRAQAALTLRSRAEEPNVRTALVAALGDLDAIVRAAAANALGAVPHTDAFEVLARRTRDRDPLVTKWARWALRRTLAAAPTVHVAHVGVKVLASGKHDDMGRVLEGAMLGILLKTGSRFELEFTKKTFDFSTDDQADSPAAGESRGQQKALELMRQGKFDAAALSIGGADDPDAAKVVVRFAAEVEISDAASGSTARARLRVETIDGVLAFDVAADGVGKIPDVAAEEVDEYSTQPGPEELRSEAVDAAGRAVAEALVSSMAAAEKPPGEQAGQAAR